MVVKAQLDLLIIVISEEFHFRRQTTTNSVATNVFFLWPVLFEALLKNVLINTCTPYELLHTQVDE